MGSKNQPGRYDCYAAAAPDEPMFILLGRDPAAAIVVEFWIALRRALGGDNDDKLAEAKQCAELMEGWARALGKADKVDRVEAAYHALIDQPLLDAARVLVERARKLAPSVYTQPLLDAVHEFDRASVR